jgi:hypothetical protein
MKLIATLVLLIALLAVLADARARPGTRVAAQDSPAAPAGTPVSAEAAVEPAATVEPTSEPIATAEPTATAAPSAAAESTPESTPESTAEPTPEPTAEPTASPQPSPTPEPPATETPVLAATEVTAAATPVETPSASLGATAEQPALTLTVVGEAVSFGRVSATGELDPAIAGLSSQVDERGAFYVLPGAVTVTVTAGVPWTGACRAQEQVGTAPTVTVAGGRLEWRLAGTGAWTPFAPGVADPACFPRPEIGTRTFDYDLRLRIEAADPPGTFRTVLVFAAVP